MCNADFISVGGATKDEELKFVETNKQDAHSFP